MGQILNFSLPLVQITDRMQIARCSTRATNAMRELFLTSGHVFGNYRSLLAEQTFIKLKHLFIYTIFSRAEIFLKWLLRDDHVGFAKKSFEYSFVTPSNIANIRSWGPNRIFEPSLLRGTVRVDEIAGTPATAVLRQYTLHVL